MQADAARSGSFLGFAADVRFGPGCAGQLASVLERDNVRRLMIVTGKTLAANAAVMDILKKTCGRHLAGVFSQTEAHVPRDVVIAGAARARELAADALLSVGGSTQNDTAKGIAWALAENITEASGFDTYRVLPGGAPGGKPVGITGAAPLLYAIPTTLSAAEFTDIAGITDRQRGHKDLYRDRKTASRTVFLDADFTLMTPEELWLSSGVKGIDHCIEAYLSPRAQPYTDALAVQALGGFLRYLPVTKRDPANLVARQECLIAAWLSLAGLANAGVGLSHGIGHNLGTMASMAHGYTSCATMRHAVAYNNVATADRQAMLLSLVKVMAAELAAPHDNLPDVLLALVRDELKLPWRLRDLGVSREQLPQIAEATMSDVFTHMNARKVESSSEVLKLLEDAW